LLAGRDHFLRCPGCVGKRLGLVVWLFGSVGRRRAVYACQVERGYAMGRSLWRRRLDWLQWSLATDKGLLGLGRLVWCDGGV